MSQILRREFPTDRRKPIYSTRYTLGGAVVRACADGVFIDEPLPSPLVGDEPLQFAAVLALAAVDHRRLRDGVEVTRDQKG